MAVALVAGAGDDGPWAPVALAAVGTPYGGAVAAVVLVLASSAAALVLKGDGAAVALTAAL